MDIVSMQIANKVLKKMRTEYDGLYETVTAIEGQLEVSTTKDFGTTGHVLKVYVDGKVAIEGVNYTITNSKTVQFTEGLKEGNVILLTTNVVGLPKYDIVNPAYNDTEIRTKIDNQDTELRTKLDALITALDEDSDGSIVDTINDIKAQWQSADTELQAHIDGKVSIAIVDAIKNTMDTKARFKSATASFDSGTSLMTIVDPFCTSSSLVQISIVGTPKGAWTVNSGDGSIAITSTAMERTSVAFNYYITK